MPISPPHDLCWIYSALSASCRNCHRRHINGQLWRCVSITLITRYCYQQDFIYSGCGCFWPEASFCPPPPLPRGGGKLPVLLASCFWVLRLPVLALCHGDMRLPLHAYQDKLVCQPGERHLLLEPMRTFGRREGLHLPTREMLIEKLPRFRA